MPSIAYNTDYQKQVEIKNDLIILESIRDEIVKYGTHSLLDKVIQSRKESISLPK